jgi:hypothetical protein
MPVASQSCRAKYMYGQCDQWRLAWAKVQIESVTGMGLLVTVAFGVVGFLLSGSFAMAIFMQDLLGVIGVGWKMVRCGMG